MLHHSLRAAQNILVLDNFTDTSGTAIASHTPNINVRGGSYRTVTTSGSSPGIQIQSNLARGTASTGQRTGVAVINAGTSDVIVSCDVNRNNVSTVLGGPGIGFRWSGSDGYFADFLTISGVGTIRLMKYVSATLTTITTANFTFSNTTTYNVKASLLGSSIKVYVDNTLYIDTTDTSVSGTDHGFSVLTDITSRTTCDNLLIVQN